MMEFTYKEVKPVCVEYYLPPYSTLYLYGNDGYCYETRTIGKEGWYIKIDFPHFSKWYAAGGQVTNLVIERKYNYVHPTM